VVIQYSAADDGLDGAKRTGDGLGGGVCGVGDGVEVDDVDGGVADWGLDDDCFSKTNFRNTWFSCFKAAFSDFNCSN
jgi:hypothetical protein